MLNNNKFIHAKEVSKVLCLPLLATLDGDWRASLTWGAVTFSNSGTYLAVPDPLATPPHGLVRAPTNEVGRGPWRAARTLACLRGCSEAPQRATLPGEY